MMELFDVGESDRPNRDVDRWARCRHAVTVARRATTGARSGKVKLGDRMRPEGVPFRLLLGFAAARTGKRACRLDIADLDATLVAAFLRPNLRDLGCGVSCLTWDDGA